MTALGIGGAGLRPTVTGEHAAQRDALAALRRRLDVASTEMTTGRRADVHAALGARSAEALTVRAASARTEADLLGNRLLADRLGAMADALGATRGSIQSFLEVATPNATGRGETVAALAASARAAYDAVTTHLNLPYGDAQLFSGVDSDRAPLRPWQSQNPGTGLTPEAAIASVVGAGLADGTDAAAKAALVGQLFDVANPLADPRAFEATFYDGTPRVDSSGGESPRVGADIGTAGMLSYGVQANDPAVLDTLRGLAMIASVDPAAIDDPDVYAEWVGTAIDAVQAGADAMRAVEARLGGQQATLGDAMLRQQSLLDLYEGQSADLEGVDPYEAAERVLSLTNQLEASYAATAMMSRLSFLDFMR